MSNLETTPAPLPVAFSEEEKAEVNARTLTKCKHCQSLHVQVLGIHEGGGTSLVTYQCLNCYQGFFSSARLQK